MMSITFTLAAGETKEFNEVGDFLRVMSASGALDVEYYRAGRIVADADDVVAGYAEKFSEPFDRFTVGSVGGDTVHVMTRSGSEVFFDATPAVNISLKAVNGAFENTQKTVTNASGQLLAGNALRRTLIVQNNDAAGIIYVTMDGSAATAANGVKLTPGSLILLDVFCPVGAINAIGDIASNANVVVVEA